MNKIIPLIILFFSVAAFNAFSQTVKDFNLLFNQPGENSWSSMPVGNGDISAQVWTEQDGSMQFYIGKTDSRDALDDLLKVGKLTVRFEPNILKEGKNYTEELLLDKGLYHIKNSLVDLYVRVDANQPIIKLYGTTAIPVKLTVTSSIWRRETRVLSDNEFLPDYGSHNRPYQPFIEADEIVKPSQDEMIWYHRNQNQIFWKEVMKANDLDKEGLINPLANRTFGALVKGKGLKILNDTMLVSSAPSKEFNLNATVLTKQTETADHYVQQLRELSTSISNLSEAQLLKTHLQWWTNFWNRSYIFFNADDKKLNDTLQLLNRGYVLQRYINAIAGRGALPIKFNGTTLVLDTHHDKIGNDSGYNADFRRWGGAYWWQNTRLPYYSMFATGDFDLMQPFMNMYWNNLPVAKLMTKKYYGHEGAHFIETAHFWGAWKGGDIGWDRTGLKPGEATNPYIKNLVIAGLEMVNYMLDYYSYTRDKEFLQQRLLPFAKEILTYYDQHFGRGENGKLIITPSQALETYIVAVNPLPEIAGLQFVIPRLQKITTDDSLLKLCNRLIEETPDLPMDMKDGTQILLPTESYKEIINVEYPELYAVFPFRLYGIGKKDIQTGVNTFEDKERTFFGWHQTGIQAALLGLTDAATKIIKANGLAYDRRFRFPGFWGPNYDYLPDQDHAANFMTTIQKMLLQADDDAIILLSAWPKNWNVKFKLHAPENTIVEGEWENGKRKSLRTFPAYRKKDIRFASE